MSDLRTAIENLGRAGRRALVVVVTNHGEASHRAGALARRDVWRAFAALVADVDRQPPGLAEALGQTERVSDAA